MLKIIDIATNLEFELPPNTKIPFNFFNPIFEESKSSTFSATLSAESPVNRRITGNYHLTGKPDNTGALIPVWFECAGERKRATFQILEADEKIIKYNLLFDEASFIVAYGDVLINQCEMGSGTVGYQATPYLPDWTDDFYKKVYPEVKAQFPPISNNIFFNGTRFETDYKTNSGYLNRPKSMEVGGTDSAIYPYAPQPFLNAIIDAIFESNKLRVSENFLHKEPLKDLLLLNNVDNAVVTLTWVNGSYSSKASNRFNYELKNHVPEKSIKNFLQSLRGKFNLIPFIDDTSKTVRLLNFDEILNTPVKSENDLTSFVSPLRLKEIPSITGVEFKMSGEITPSFEADYVDYETVKNKLLNKNNPFDLSDLPTISGDFKENGIYIFKPDDTVYKFYGNKYYQLWYNTDPEVLAYEWKDLGYSDIGNIYADNEINVKKIESEFGTTFATGGAVVMMSYEREGISEYIEANPDKNYGMILAFYRPPNATYQYPQAYWADSRLAQDVNNVLINGGINGTVNNFFKRSIEFYINKGKIYETKPNLPVSKLLNFNWSTKYIIKEGSFLVKNLKGEFNYDGSITYKDSEVVEC